MYLYEVLKNYNYINEYIDTKTTTCHNCLLSFKNFFKTFTTSLKFNYINLHLCKTRITYHHML